MKMKKITVFLLAGILFLTQIVSVYAKTSPERFQGTKSGALISLQWSNVNDIWLDLYFESNEACCAGTIEALPGTTKISAIFTLERKTLFGWALEKSWSQSSSTESLTFFGTDVVARGYTYRLSVTADVTRNGGTETVSTSVEGKY